MVKKLPIISEIFKGDHNAAAAEVARKLTRNQISALFRDAYLSKYFFKVQTILHNFGQIFILSENFNIQYLLNIATLIAFDCMLELFTVKSFFCLQKKQVTLISSWVKVMTGL